jgi:hypothetical protein
MVKRKIEIALDGDIKNPKKKISKKIQHPKMSSYTKTDDFETRSLSAAFKEVSQRSLGISIPDIKQKNSTLNPIKAAHLRTVSEKAALLGRSILHATFEAATSAGRSPPIKIVPNDHDRSECTRNLDSFERSLARYQHRSAIPPERGLTWSRDAPKILEEIQSLIPGMPNPLLLTSEASKLYEKHHAISLKYMILQMVKLKRGLLGYILMGFLIVILFFKIFILTMILICLDFLRLLDFTIYPSLLFVSLFHSFADRFDILFIIISLKFHLHSFFLLRFYFNTNNYL